METDRRQAARKRLDQLAYIRIGPDNGGLVSDISESGIGFQTIVAVESGEPLSFWFTLDNGDRIQATGELAWSDEERKLGGLRFKNIPREAIEQIRDWMGRSGAPVEVAKPSRHAPRDPLAFFPSPRTSSTAAMPQTSAALRDGADDSDDSVAAAAPPPPVAAPRPEPLRVMAKMHQSFTPVLSQPPRGVISPEMVRGATTGLTILAVILTAVGLFYGFHRELGRSLVRLGEKVTGESPLADAAPASSPLDTVAAAPQPVSADPPVSTTPVSTTPVSTDASLDPGAPRVASPQPHSTAAPPSPRPSAAAPKRSPSPASSAGFQNLSVSKSPPDDFGQLELDTARQFLETKDGERKSSEAAKWLWLSVEKGNPAAEILLADLFARGDGVIKSCSQARVLLAAAIKHGDSEAIRKLRALDATGCQ